MRIDPATAEDTAIRPMARSMVVAGKAGTTVFFMVTLMAAATLVTRALRAIVALATASQDMPALAGMMAGLDMAEAGMVAGLDMAAEAGMVAGATTDDQDQFRIRTLP